MTDRSHEPPYFPIVEWDPRDDVFVVTIPEFERCHSDGRDYEEAVRTGRKVTEIAVDLDRGLGLQLPAPRILDEQHSNRPWNTIQEAIGVVVAEEDNGYPPYSMVLEWDPRDAAVIATIPEFRGSRSHGNTYEQAAHMAREVIEMFVDQARESGDPLPSVRVFRPRRVAAVV